MTDYRQIDYGGVPDGLAAWTTDRCANVVLGEFILHENHAPLFDGNTIPLHLQVGYEYPITMHLTRVVEYTEPQPVIIPPEIDPNDLTAIYESCRLHVGEYVLYNGYERTIVCNGVHAAIMEDCIWQASIMPVWLNRGYEYSVGAHPTPTMIEVHIGSPLYICGIPV